MNTNITESPEKITPAHRALDLFGDAIPSPRCYADIKALAKATGRRIPDLLAMSCQNDPFYTMPAQVKQAEWFAALWDRLNIPHGAHIRRIHYRFLSQPEPVVTVDGKPYENTDSCWQDMSDASKAARNLGLVSPDAFVDKRNPPPILNRHYCEQADNPELTLDWFNWYLPEIDVDLASSLDWIIPSLCLNGYKAEFDDEPFHLELISEKSTMDDILIPLDIIRN